MPARPGTLLLIRHAPSAATRGFRFPGDEPLDEAGRRAAEAFAGTVCADRAVTSPLRRCRETAALAGFPDASVDPDLAELDFGRWAGRDPHEISRTDPAELEAWYADPRTAPHGGETLAQLTDRITAALDRLRNHHGVTAVFTHGGPIKVAILAATSAPLSSIWDIEVAPLSVTPLRPRRAGGWEIVAGGVGTQRPLTEEPNG